MPRLIAEETDDGSGPVEAILESYPVGPCLRASLRSHSDPVLRSSLSPHDCVESLKVGHFILVDLAHVGAVLELIFFLNAGYKDPLVLLLIIKDDLNFPSGLHGVLQLCGSVLQHVVADLLLETAQKHRVEHQELHPGYSLAHDLVRLGLCNASMQSAHIGGGVSGLTLVVILEGGGHPVVEVLDCLVVLLPEVLETDAEGLGRVLWGIGLQELLLQLVPDVLVEPDYVVQLAVPGQGVVP
jgi:hypothetical protein